MKKLGIALISSTLLASAAQAHWEGNFLAGISGGYAQRSGHVNTNITHYNDLQTTSSDRLKDSNGIWGFLAGYQARCNGWLVGGELNIDWWNSNNDKSYNFTDVNGRNWDSSLSFGRNANVGLTARVGYDISSYFIPYLRAGIETNKNKLSYTASSADGTGVAPGSAVAASLDESKRSYHFVGGAGIEFALATFSTLEGLSLRLEYNYHAPSRSTGASVLADDGVSVVHADTKQRANSGKASLVYNFL